MLSFNPIDSAASCGSDVSATLEGIVTGLEFAVRRERISQKLHRLFVATSQKPDPQIFKSI
jgi:hypothetical protein